MDPENGVKDLEYGATDSQTNIYADQITLDPAMNTTSGNDHLGNSDKKLTENELETEIKKSETKSEKKTKLNSALGMFSIDFWQAYFDVNQYEI